MKRIAVLMMLLTCLTAGLFADNTGASKERTEKYYTFAILTQPLPEMIFPLLGVYNLNLTMQFAMGSGCLGTSVGASFGRVGSSFYGTGGYYDANYLIDAEVFYRFTLTPDPVKGPLDGFYISPGIRYEVNNIFLYSYGVGALPSHRVGSSFDIGYQMVNNGFVLDLNIGTGYYFFDSYDMPFKPYLRAMFEVGLAL